jgi:predicted MFS family arabinose efflux permease
MIFAGLALGSAVAGAVVDRAGASAGLVVTAVAGALTLAVSLSSRHWLVPATRGS